MEFGKRLKEARELKNLSQCELAKKTGIKNDMISLYEKGAYQPSLRTLEWL